MTTLSDSEIINSWHINADPWIKAIANAEVESRTLVTNQAIIDRILENKPRNLLDVGCDEDWLSRVIANDYCNFLRNLHLILTNYIKDFDQTIDVCENIIVETARFIFDYYVL